MRSLVILGGGTAGTMVANRLRKRLDGEWRITVVDQDDHHDYQPGYLFIPFGTSTPEQVRRSRHRFIGDGIELVLDPIERVDAPAKTVHLASGRTLTYDYLVIATGTTPRPDQTPGMAGPELGKTVHEFYSYDGSVALADALGKFTHGRLVVHITEMPIKCPVAPLEFAFLADDYFRRRGIRQDVEITFVTPLDGAFTKPVASRELGGALAQRDIRLETDFMVEEVDNEAHALLSYDGRDIPFDLLVTVPVNMGADYVARSGLGDDYNYVPCDKHTLVADADDSIFVLGDAGTLPTSKAGAVAHFATDVFEENFVALAAGKPMTHSFDGHANCFIESGNGKAMLLDFNYDTEPLTGTFPFPRVGPFTLLRESRANHLAKLAFEQVYWHMLLPGRPIPLPAAMSMRGKVPAPAAPAAPPASADGPTIPTF